MLTAYKLFRVRKDGSIGPLYINASQRIQTNIWLRAGAYRTPGFAFRPGWHACPKPIAPHLSKRGRQWYRVQLEGVTMHVRPKSHGGLWYTARSMKVLGSIGRKR